MKKSVGCVVLTSSREKGFQVALQRRGVQDSYPGACQVTIDGKVKEGDKGKDGGFYNALLRESREELGHLFTEICREGAELIELYREKTSEKEMVTFGALIPESWLDQIRLERTSGGIDLVSADIFFNGGVVEISSTHKQDGYPPTVRAMFPDEIKAVRKALEVFKDCVAYG